MMKGQTIVQVENPAEILRNRDGKFKVTSPNGYMFQVTCRRGRKIRIREIGEPEPSTDSTVAKWQIEQIA